MTKYTALPISRAALQELRHVDDAGRAVEPYAARDDGVPIASVGSPLRCCLRPISRGERVALVGYAPLRRWAAETGARPGAYDEIGPVFIHADRCAGPAPGMGYPCSRPGALRTIRRYRADGHIIGGAMFQIPADAEAGFDHEFDAAFADPQVALVQVRALEYGCFQFEVRRPATS